MSSSDLNNGVHVGNYGNNFKMDSANSDEDCDDSLLTTRREFVLVRNVGVQVWHKKTQTREMFDAFRSREKTKEARSFVLNSHASATLISNLNTMTSLHNNAPDRKFKSERKRLMTMNA